MKETQKNRSVCHCITMRRASNAITEYYDAAFKPLQLTTSQYSLLKNLSRLETASTSELAEQMKLDRSTLVRNLKPMLQRGLICDLAKENARNHKYTLSESGEELLQKAMPVWAQAQEEIQAYLGEGNMDFFMELLYKLQELKRE